MLLSHLRLSSVSIPRVRSIRLALAIVAASLWLPCSCSAAAEVPAQGVLAEWILAQAQPEPGFALDLGCGDAGLAIEVAKRSPLFVQCFSPDEPVVDRAREAILAAGIYGRGAAADLGALDTLLLPANCARLVLCGDAWVKRLDTRDSKELLRVLHPFGVALVGQSPAGAAQAGEALTRAQLEGWLRREGLEDYHILEEHGLWARIAKPRPPGWDEWPSRNHDAGNSCASAEQLPGMQYRMQWVNHPEPVLASAGMCVAGGRQYVLGYYYPGQEHATPSIYAYDAFTGIRLWSRVGKREVPFDRAFSSYAPEKSCSDFVATADALYLLGGDQCYVFDGPSGAIRRQIALPEGLQGIFNYVALSGDTLVFASGRPTGMSPGNYSMFPRGQAEALFAIDRRSGALLWIRRGGVRANSLAVGEEKVYFLTVERELCALDLASGKECWSVRPSFFKHADSERRGGYVCLSAYYRGQLWILYNRNDNWLGGGRQTAVFSAADGTLLFEPSFTGVVHMLAFAGDFAVATPQHSGNPSSFVRAESGEMAWSKGLPLGGCTPVFGSQNMLLARLGSGPGLIALDPKLGTQAFRSMRSTCFLPPMPAYGQLLVPAPGCNCGQSFRASLALVPGPVPPPEKTQPLVRGPAFGTPVDDLRSSGWRTWRADAQRTGFSPAQARGRLVRLWSTAFGGATRGLCAAAGTLYCASTERQVWALEASSGKPRWRYLAEGGIGAPPCLWGGRIYFGTDDGWLHCLKAEDGQLVWKFRAALAEDRIFGYGRLMSRWPVAAGVVVQDGMALFACGFYPEDQSAAFALDAASGELKWRAIGRAAASGILASDEKRLIVPSRWGGASQVALEGAQHGFGGAAGAKGGLATLVQGEVLIAAADLEYTHHVNGYHRYVGALPIVTGQAVYLRDGKRLTAERREAIACKDGRLVASDPAIKQKEKIPANALLWEAWKGETMSAVIKVGSTLFSGSVGWVFATGEDGQTLDAVAVPGTVVDLAFDEGRLFVLTEPGEVVCFKVVP